MRRPRHRPQRCGHRGHHLGHHRSRVFAIKALFERHEDQRHLPLQLVLHPDHRGLGHARVTGDGLFDLTRAQAVAGHVDHIVGAAQDEGVAIVIADGPVQRAVQQFLEVAEVTLQEAAVVIPDRAHAARRQRRRHHQDALLPGSYFFTGVLVDHLHPVAEIGETW
ncbi:hypothetical protein D3C73_984060 [compost metagenome]